MAKRNQPTSRSIWLSALAVLASVFILSGLLMLSHYLSDLRTSSALGSSLSMLRKDTELASTSTERPKESSESAVSQTRSTEGTDLGAANQASITTIEDAITTNEGSNATHTEATPAYTFTDNDFLPLFRINPDTIGWLKIGDTRIDYPIVKGVDNEFYLDHGFDKAPNVAGAVFMDTRNIGDGTDRHTLIYGHRMKDGSMFRDLEKYQDADFYHEHLEFELQTLHGTRRYRVFSTYVTDTDFLFIKTRFEDNAFPAFLKEIQEKSLFPAAEAGMLHENSKILTLATCSRAFADARFVVHAVLLEADEP